MNIQFYEIETRNRLNTYMEEANRSRMLRTNASHSSRVPFHKSIQAIRAFIRAALTHNLDSISPPSSTPVLVNRAEIASES
jgi:hypothetical protein